MLDIVDREGLRFIRMCHGKASALDLEFAEAFERAFRDAGESAARAIVLTGTGSIFSAGVDLPRVVAGGRDYLSRFLPAFERAMRAVYFIEKPVIGAINGHAIAGGWIIACACDVRVAARGKATFGVPELEVGVPFPPIAVEILRGATSAQHLGATLFLGRKVSVDEAHARGLFDELVDAEQLAERARELALQLAAVPTRSFALTKRLLRAPAFDVLDRHEARAASELVDVWSAPESLAAISRFVERTLRK